MTPPDPFDATETVELSHEDIALLYQLRNEVVALPANVLTMDSKLDALAGVVNTVAANLNYGS